MFESLFILGPTERSIVVETRKGSRIRNFIAPEPEHQHRQSYRLLLKKHGKHWIERKAPTGVYNCTGHVWASRRTALSEEKEWWLILDEDGYRRLAEGESPVPDDLVLYLAQPEREIMHVARIVEVRPGVAAGSPGIPWAVSKWDAKSGEVMHSAYDVPYEAQYGSRGFKLGIEFWSDRRKEEAEK